jgi:hypothetical protein
MLYIHTVLMPNGKVARRESARRTYTHVVLVNQLRPYEKSSPDLPDNYVERVNTANAPRLQPDHWEAFAWSGSEALARKVRVNERWTQIRIVPITARIPARKRNRVNPWTPRCDDPTCWGWIHMDDSCGRGPGIGRCDLCDRFADDDAAAAQHRLECPCGLDLARDDEPAVS